MSIAIDVNSVSRVLLADGWHDVRSRPSAPKQYAFDLDSYEFLDGTGHDAHLLHGGGQGGICATGFVFLEAGTEATLSGPLTSVLAVQHG